MLKFLKSNWGYWETIEYFDHNGIFQLERRVNSLTNEIQYRDNYICYSDKQVLEKLKLSLKEKKC